MTTLSVRDLSITRQRRRLCQHLSFTISPGDYWAVLGPNGCGKTTLLHTLCGQLPATSGEILLNNQAITHLKRRELAQQIGILFQTHTHPFPQIVRDYCLDARFPHHTLLTAGKHAEADRIRLQHILNRLQLTDLADKNIQQLSGGEQRRAAIAALLMQSPDIYVLDEPINHLDLHHQIETMSIFKEASRTHGIIMAVHDINLAAHDCNKILMLFQDGTSMQGSCSEMLTTELLSRLYQHPIDVIQAGDQTYWQPRRTNLTKKETPWEFAY